jgi:acyl-CoA synthetase (AMP-forming)/AMP-acid ligase II
VGLPHAFTEVRIVGEDGAECAPGEVGELFSRSPFMFSGYWNKPVETEGVFRDGWVSVGDMAKRDGDGYIYIVDRKKDMVISGGVNIYPREIEEVLMTHPGILDAAVIGVLDEKWGERLRAFAVPREGVSLTVEAMVEHCTGRIAAYKIPRELRLVAALPRNANGKVLKTDLRGIA